VVVGSLLYLAEIRATVDSALLETCTASLHWSELMDELLPIRRKRLDVDAVAYCRRCRDTR